MTVLSQGAEATIELKDGKVFKFRKEKSYRNSKLDESLRTSRTKREIKVMNKLRELEIKVPEVFPFEDKYTIVMEYVDGKRLRDFLIEDISNKKYLEVAGKWLAKMHNEGIIHGDLTTSNMMLSEELYFIDFGLSFFSDKIEDKAVDIHLLKQAIESTHYQHVEEFYNEFVKGYNSLTNNPEVFQRLEIVEKRGRNKH